VGIVIGMSEDRREDCSSSTSFIRSSAGRSSHKVYWEDELILLLTS